MADDRGKGGADGGAIAALPTISVCIPVLNGAARLPGCLASLRALDYPKHLIEIVIADGGSTDDTRNIARSYGALVLDNPGRTVAAGRNVAFAAATGEVIASTDDDCVVPADWGRRAVAAFETPDVAAVGGLSLLPEGVGPWPKAAHFIFRLASLAGQSVQADRLKAGDVDDLPGCNVFYRTDATRRIGAFDERLITAEDVDYHLRLRAAGHRLRAVPGLFVWHHRRPTVRGLFRQLRRYARGRVQLGRTWPGAVRMAHHLLGLSLPILGVVTAVGLALAPALFIGAGLGAAALLVGLARRGGLSLTGALLTPMAMLIIAMGWSVGYLGEHVRTSAIRSGRFGG